MGTLPTKRIKQVKLPGDNNGDKTYDIIPTMLQDGSTTNKLSVPTLSVDSVIAVNKKNNYFLTEQTITSTTDSPLTLTHDSSIAPFLTIGDDNIQDYSYLYVTDNTEGHSYYFPDASGTIGLQVDIVDLTNL